MHLFQLCLRVDRHLTHFTVERLSGHTQTQSGPAAHALLHPTGGFGGWLQLDPALRPSSLRSTIKHLFVPWAWFSQNRRLTLKLGFFWDQWTYNLYLYTIIMKSFALHTTAVGLQLQAWIDRHFARWTMKIFFAALGLLSLFHLLFASCWIFLRFWTWSTAGGGCAGLQRMTVWGWIRYLPARADLRRHLRGAKGGRVCRGRLWGGSVCQRTPWVRFYLLMSRLGRGTCSCVQLDK